MRGTHPRVVRPLTATADDTGCTVRRALPLRHLNGLQLGDVWGTRAPPCRVLLLAAPKPATARPTFGRAAVARISCGP
jgi:hypothetical protein